MYFPKLHPDELLYSAIARCRVHLGIGNHKTLLHMLFGDSKVAAITDLPTHLIQLTNNTGLVAEGVIQNHTLFPLYAPFIPPERRTDLFQAMLASNRPTIGLSGASTALVKWPEWLRYCPFCFEDMATCFGEPYWRRSWQIRGIDACPKHGCQLLDSPTPFRRAQRHEFHPASSLLLSRDLHTRPASEEAIRIAKAATQLLTLEEVQSLGYGRWTNLYRYLAKECGARRGRQVRADVIWEKILASHCRAWLSANGLLTSGVAPPWLLAIFRKHRKGFSALQHLIVWTSLRPDQHVSELIREAKACQNDSIVQYRSHPTELGKLKSYQIAWIHALDNFGSAKAARENGGAACYAWLYRHDRHWLMAMNHARKLRLGNNSHINWLDRDRALVRLLIKISKGSDDDLSLPRRSCNWFLQQIPHRASVRRHLDKLPLCRSFLERYAESIAEYQIRRLTKAILYDRTAGRSSRPWELIRHCGLEERKMAPLAARFLDYLRSNYY